MFNDNSGLDKVRVPAQEQVQRSWLAERIRQYDRPTAPTTPTPTNRNLGTQFDNVVHVDFRNRRRK